MPSSIFPTNILYKQCRFNICRQATDKIVIDLKYYENYSQDKVISKQKLHQFIPFAPRVYFMCLNNV